MLSGLGHHNKNTNNPTNNPYSARASNSSMNDPNYPQPNTYNQPLHPNPSNPPFNNSNYRSTNQPLDSNTGTYNQPLHSNINTQNQPFHSNIHDKDRIHNTTDPYRNDHLNRNQGEQGIMHPHMGYHHHGTGTNTTGTGVGGGTGLSHTLDADRDRNMNRVESHPTNNTSNLGTQPYNSTGTTGLGTSQYGSTGTQQQPYGTTGQQHPYGTTGQQQPYGTAGTQQQPYGTQQQGYGTQQQPYGTTSGTGTAPGVNRPMSVEDVTRNVQAQIDAQAEQAIRKSRELNAQDHARLQASIREATASLEEQARQLKQQIDQEKAIAAQHVKQMHDTKLHETAQVQQMEEQKIYEAAAQRKIELEQRAMKLQQEIDAIVRQKTEEMMREKPGNLCFTHQHQDATIGAQLAGDIGHILDLKNSGRITETTMQGNNQYHPNMQQQPLSGNTYNQEQPSNMPMSQNTIQGQETHEKKGGFFHALKTALTGHHDQNNNTNTNQYGTQQQPMMGNTGYNNNNQMKQQPMMANVGYDQQSTWASDADKHMPQQQQPTR